MVKYLLDSNVIIDYLREDENILRNVQETQKSGDSLYICSIVYYEVVRGFKISDASKRLRSFFNLYKQIELLPIDIKVADKAVEIYLQLHNGLTIEDNDIYIAATAMVNDCVLVTANTKHFGRVENLNFVNWRM